jgi:hypothetical protein
MTRDKIDTTGTMTRLNKIDSSTRAKEDKDAEESDIKKSALGACPGSDELNLQKAMIASV